MIKLFPGKYYRTRHGKRAYCIGKSGITPGSDEYVCEISTNEGMELFYYYGNGNWGAEDGEVQSAWDIVSEGT